MWITDPGRQPPLGYFPQLLDTDRIKLRQLALIELQPVDKCLREIASDAVGQDRDLGANVDAWLERRLVLAVPADPAVACPNPDDAIAVVQQLGRGEPREDVDALGFDEPPEPLDEPAQRDEVVAVILERRRRDRKWNPGAARQKIHMVVVDLRGERRALLFEVGHELAESRRVEDRARERMRAHFA